MTTAVQPAGGGGGSSAGGLADVIDTILDKGLVIDAYVSVSLLGIQLLTVDARVVVASVETYLQFAEATDRLDLTEHEKPGVGDLVGGPLPGERSGEAEDSDRRALQAAPVDAEADDEAASGEKAGSVPDAAHEAGPREEAEAVPRRGRRPAPDRPRKD
ncbi:gas vesicle protein [Thermomonospora catenispora]|nr:gas vesicle protein GvpJ [Thermomonospora catenispora]TNY38179.1 gas vesicle protein [Thermomonospora catenispora]